MQGRVSTPHPVAKDRIKMLAAVPFYPQTSKRPGLLVFGRTFCRIVGKSPPATHLTSPRGRIFKAVEKCPLGMAHPLPGQRRAQLHYTQQWITA